MDFYVGQVLSGAQPEYAAAIAWCTANGCVITYIPGTGFVIELAAPPPIGPQLVVLYADYVKAMDRLKLAWATAGIAGGDTEASKKASISQAMHDLTTAYNADFNTILNGG